jgi:hypothetical protein
MSSTPRADMFYQGRYGKDPDWSGISALINDVLLRKLNIELESVDIRTHLSRAMVIEPDIRNQLEARLSVLEASNSAMAEFVEKANLLCDFMRNEKKQWFCDQDERLEAIA